MHGRPVEARTYSGRPVQHRTNAAAPDPGGGHMPIVEARALEKHFGKTKALRDLDFDVEAGTVLAMLGPNGAGKTTAVRILSTLLRPDGGRASIDGHDVVTHPHEVRSRIGLTGQYAAVDERLTAR